MYDIETGERIGIGDIEAEFIRAARALLNVEDVFIVVGTDTPTAFVEKLESEGLPVLVDERADGGALIVGGDRDEWAALVG